jgi:hypothetical protein
MPRHHVAPTALFAAGLLRRGHPVVADGGSVAEQGCGGGVDVGVVAEADEAAAVPGHEGGAGDLSAEGDRSFVTTS